MSNGIIVHQDLLRKRILSAAWFAPASKASFMGAPILKN